MTPNEFIHKLRAAVVDENIEIYRNLFSESSSDAVSDPYWKRALLLFQGLSVDQQGIFLSVLRQVIVDTTSNLLGIIDGTSFVDGIGAELNLKFGDDITPLNGDLQSIFLALEEKLSNSAATPSGF